MSELTIQWELLGPVLISEFIPTFISTRISKTVTFHQTQKGMFELFFLKIVQQC